MFFIWEKKLISKCRTKANTCLYLFCNDHFLAELSKGLICNKAPERKLPS